MPATLLLADDSVTIQRVIELTFANEAIRVVTVADGHAATAWFDTERPDIVLADVGLPSVDGYALTERVKRSPQTAGVPVLLLTGAFEPIDEGRARQCGCDGVLVKPFEPQRLVSMVKELLAGKTPGNLWPADMPRIDAPVTSTALPVATSRPAVARRETVSEPGPLPPPSAIEEVFEIGLDDLDQAFSRLDPVAAPSRLDAASVSDFQRDIQELRNTAPFPESAPPFVAAPAPVAPPPQLEPVDEATPVEPLDLVWDLPTPVAVEAPVAPPPEPPAPAAIVAPVVAPAAEPIVEPVVTPPPVDAPPVDAPPVDAPPVAPPSLANAFSALLAAEQSQPASSRSASSGSSVTDADVEEVVRRVVARLTETSERLIREEFERLKR
jgi:CheY-like chemotaxis protein